MLSISVQKRMSVAGRYIASCFDGVVSSARYEVEHLFSQKNEMIKWDPVIYEPLRLWLHWSVARNV